MSSIKNDPEWPPQEFTKLDLTGLNGLKVSPVSIRIAVDVAIDCGTSPLTVASGTEIIYRKGTEKARTVVARVVPSSDEKWAVWKIGG